jgi:hypothetical protein
MKSLEMQECQFENSLQSQRNGLKVGWNSPKGWGEIFGLKFYLPYRDVTAGATGATKVASKFSDTLTLFQLEGSDSAPTSQRLH